MKKIKFDWKHALFFFVLMGGIYFITESFAMSLGILLLLFVADYFMQLIDDKIRQKRAEKDNEQ